MNTVILFVFGAVIGSFLNVLALRYPKLPLARSACPKCGTRLQWFELIPIISFLALRGRCKNCQVKISWQYPLVEIWTGLVFVTVPMLFIPVFCLYIAISIYDFWHKIIPDFLVFFAIVLALVSSFGFRASNLAAGAILFLFFASVWLFSGGRAMGFGDAKLGLSIGFLLGLPLALSSLVLSFWLGAAYGITLMLFSRKNITMKSGARITLKSELPFGPFMVLGAWLAIIFQLDLLHITEIF